MKVRFLLAALVMTLMFSLSVKAAGNEDDVKQAITSYTKSSDTQNVSELQKVVATNANFVGINKINNSTIQLNGSDFINAVKTGKTGGWNRNLTISSLDANDNIAVAKIELTDSKLLQTEYLTLAKLNGNWKVVSSAYTVEKKK